MTPKTFFDAVDAHLKELLPSHVHVGYGKAPDYPDGSRIDPYVVVWPSPGTPLDERDTAGLMGRDATTISFQVTTVAPDPATLLLVLNDATDALTEATIGGHLVRPDVIVNRDAKPLQDTTVRPVRHYMVTTWHTTLTRVKETPNV